MSRRWSHRLWWLLGGFLVCVGAVSGAFGTVAWLTVLCAPTLPRMLLGVFAFGVTPLVGGGAVLWSGLSILEAQAVRAHVLTISEGHLAELVRGGATAATVAQRLNSRDVAEVTERLDEMVARDVLSLDLTEDGELIYEAPRRV